MWNVFLSYSVVMYGEVFVQNAMMSTFWINNVIIWHKKTFMIKTCFLKSQWLWPLTTKLYICSFKIMRWRDKCMIWRTSWKHNASGHRGCCRRSRKLYIWLGDFTESVPLFKKVYFYTHQGLSGSQSPEDRTTILLAHNSYTPSLYDNVMWPLLRLQEQYLFYWCQSTFPIWHFSNSSQHLV